MVFRSPLYYDLKRGILRLSVIVLLVLSIALGIGLAYRASVWLANSPFLASGALLFTVDPGKKLAYVEGYMLVPAQEGPVDAQGSLIYKILCGEPDTDVASWSVIADEVVNFIGYFRSEVYLEDEIAKYLVKGEYDCIVGFLLYTPFYRIVSSHKLDKVTIDRRTVYSLAWIPQGSRLDIAFPYFPLDSPTAWTWADLTVGIDVVKERHGALLVILVSNPANVDEEFELYVRKVDDTGIPEVKVGSFRHGVSISRIQIEVDEGDGLVITVVRKQRDPYYNYITSHHHISASVRDLTLSLKRMAIPEMLNAQSASTFIFSLVVVYLVYVYVAKPRSQGALEFIIARPISRLDLYLTRFTAGTVVLVVATTVFYFAIVKSVSALLKVTLDMYTATLLYAGILIPLTAFYSFCFLLSTLTSGVRYLVSSIVAYLLFGPLIYVITYFVVVAIHGGTWYGPVFPLDLERANYIVMHFSPLGFREFTKFYILQNYRIVSDEVVKYVSDITNPVFVALSTLLWITVPFIVGWLVFRRANLSR